MSSNLVISGGIVKFGHGQVMTRIGWGGDFISSPFSSFFCFFFPAIQRVIATELSSSLRCLPPSVELLRLPFLLMARGQRYDRGSVCAASGLCVTFCKMPSSSGFFCLPVWEGEQEAGDFICNRITYV